MSDRTAIPNSTSGFFPSSPQLVGLLLLGGCLNGLIAEIARNWHEMGWAAAGGLFGIGFYNPAVMLVAFSHIIAPQDSKPLPQASAALALVSFCLLVLVQSSLFAWLAVLLYGSLYALTGRGSVRIGAALFAALGLCSIWSDFEFKFFVTSLTNLDAALAQNILQFFGFVVERHDNVLTQASGFSVVILTDCSTWKYLPLEILAFIAVSLFGGANIRSRKLWVATLAIIPLLILINLARLAVISVSNDLHQTVHSDIGRNIYDFMRVSIVFALAWLAAE